MNIQTFLEEACKFVHKINDFLIRQPNDKESYFYSELYAYCKVINQCQNILGFLTMKLCTQLEYTVPWSPY